MTIPTIIRPVGTRRPEITWITINKEYEVQEFVPPSLCWIEDDEGELIAVMIPSLHPDGLTGCHHGQWKVVA